MTTRSLLSVVVTVVDGGEALKRCLLALLTQQGPPSMEVLVPYDSTMPSVPLLVPDVTAVPGLPAIRFVNLGNIPTTQSPLSPRGQHELIDRRRAAGLDAAQGDLIAILEDRGVPRPDWAASVVRLHGAWSNSVIGGAVENGCDRLLNWAVYFCDFGRYQLPLAAGPRQYVTDVNVSYKRRALELTREIWRERFHEPLVHWALERAGETLFLSPEIVVDQVRDGVTLRGLVNERFAWGRLFGSLRVRDASPASRLVWALSSPFVPPVLFARFLRDQISKRASIPRLVRVTPAVILLMCAWAAGEGAGYMTGRS